MSRSSVYFTLGLCLLLAGGALAKTAAEWKSRNVYQILTDRFWRSNNDTTTACDLGTYCGGDHEGIRLKLQYIKDLGFDAIWISPIVDNAEGAYHGYAARDWEKTNSHFGTDDDLIRLVQTAHSMDIWVMLDVVANHVACLDKDDAGNEIFTSINPFNKPEFYHKPCIIEDWNNQKEVETCRLFCLPDLDQSNLYVRQYLKDWVRKIVQKFSFDGIRIDTGAHIEKVFWKEYTQSAGVFSIGEVFRESDQSVADYQRVMDSLLYYPMYFTIKDVFITGNSMKQISYRWDRSSWYFRDMDSLGLFMDNHDNPRFLNQQPNLKLFRNAVTFTLTARGIPFFYYGTEQEFNGGGDPLNREPMWNSFNQESKMYKFVQTINKARKTSNAHTGPFNQRYVDDDVYVYTKGQMMVILTNRPDKVIQREIKVYDLPENQQFCSIFDDKACVKVLNSKISFSIPDGEPIILVAKSSAQAVSVAAE